MNLQTLEKTMRIKIIFNPWKRASQLERENQRLRDCLEHEEQRNLDYMFNRMQHERQKYAQMEAMNEHLMKTAVNLVNMTPPTFIVRTEAEPENFGKNHAENG